MRSHRALTFIAAAFGLLLSSCAGSCDAVGIDLGAGISSVDFSGGISKGKAAAAAAAATPPGTPSLWYDGSDIDGDGSNNSAYTDGDPVTTWVDKGSLGEDITQATAASKPTFRTSSGPGGNDTLEWDGGDYLRASAVNASLKFMHDGTGASLYAVANVTTANALRSLGGTNAATGNNHGIYVGWDNRSSVPRTSAALLIVGDGSSPSIVDSSVDSSWTAASETLYAVRQASAATPDWAHYVNDMASAVASGSYVNAPSTSNPSQALQVGAVPGGSTLGWVGTISEIIAYTTDDDATDRGDVKTYAESKWGVTF